MQRTESPSVRLLEIVINEVVKSKLLDLFASVLLLLLHPLPAATPAAQNTARSSA
ncbi:MAG: hypothetical protein HAW58_03405, partial [Candidatus Thioglobus sp.]|nr:hypothetical protein [Candidatus Thioglobus sp.]